MKSVSHLKTAKFGIVLLQEVHMPTRKNSVQKSRFLFMMTVRGGFPK